MYSIRQIVSISVCKLNSMTVASYIFNLRWSMCNKSFVIELETLISLSGLRYLTKLEFIGWWCLNLFKGRSFRHKKYRLMMGWEFVCYFEKIGIQFTNSPKKINCRLRRSTLYKILMASTLRIIISNHFVTTKISRCH